MNLAIMLKATKLRLPRKMTYKENYPRLARNVQQNCPESY